MPEERASSQKPVTGNAQKLEHIHMPKQICLMKEFAIRIDFMPCEAAPVPFHPDGAHALPD
ncbi:hypothetical protein [Cupriavidus sp. D39]|uniref:hypothetical protein n=1 Tax=Cupriavidus sp. D39 TaxID=2997877 RepID=UPI0022702BFC|nr:hypothetical protein [Cupriavidus sp. D39]MCY0858652.1 hypothetical protein [Cupriavidus sp. D39]